MVFMHRHGWYNMVIKTRKPIKIFNDRLKKILFHGALLQIISIIITVIDFHGSLSLPDLLSTVRSIPIYFVFTNIIGILIFILQYVYKKTFPNFIHTKFLHLIAQTIIITVACIAGTFISFEVFLYFYWSEWTPVIQGYVIRDNLLITYTIFILLGMYWMHKASIEKKSKEIDALKQLHIESKLAALQAKMNPHFLFNTLNSIIELGYTNPAKLEVIVTKLSNIFRKTLAIPDNTLIPLDTELGLVTDYLEIESMRLGSRLEHSIEADPALLNFPIIPLTIETLVENAIIHGIAPKDKGGYIKIRVFKNADTVTISICDNGIGLENGPKKSGFGTGSIATRLRFYYGETATFTLKARPEGGTCAIMEVPYEYATENAYR